MAVFDAVAVGLLTVTSLPRIMNEINDPVTAPTVIIALALASLILGVAAVITSARRRHGWAALTLLLATTTSLSPLGILHLAGGLLALGELILMVHRRGRPAGQP
ncbi:MAG TPA: hypothetical protein VNV66_19275 [Pilimelia sp.]|nr:hypothetical protein [Pilimelia sp.]